MGKYSFTSRVRFSETGEDKKLDLTSIVNYFQDCSTFQTEDLGIGFDWLEPQNLVWILARWQIILHRRPALGEAIRVTTWPYRFTHAIGSRNFILETEDGELLAEADSLWVYQNFKTGELVNIGDYEARLYDPLPAREMAYAPRKIRLPKVDPEPQEPFPVTVSHIDANHHVNNGQYLKMAENYLPEGFEIGEMRIEYRKSAVLHDIIHPVLYRTEGELFIDLAGDDGATYAMVHFLKK